MRNVHLIDESGGRFPWQPTGRTAPPPPAQPITSRVAYAAAHVVADPTRPGQLDWEATLAFRHYLWDQGLGVAEAMDTAQRGMGLGWDLARELIIRTAAEAGARGAAAVFGVATDQLTGPAHLEQIEVAYREQLAVVEEAGGEAIVMASRALVDAASGPEDYLGVYRAVIGAAQRPVMIHWLGEVFDPALSGYWGSNDPWQAAKTVIELAQAFADRIKGIKISLLDDALEIHLRRNLPSGVEVFTGDDFNFMPLVLGDETGHSHALLGVFDPIAPVAAQALAALDRGDREAYRRWLEPTVPFSRHLFTAPTYHYKTGITFLAYLNGHQDHFRMLGGVETARSLPHLCQLLVLADQASLLRDPDLAVSRIEDLLP